MAMERLFQLMKAQQASDMFFAVNAPVHLKIHGELVPVNQQKLDAQHIHALLAEVASPAQLAELAHSNELNMGISVPELGRFRLSAFRQRGTISAVFRFIPAVIPALAELHLPAILAQLIMEKRGLLLMVGATGSGKSTTIASMLDHRNARRSGHILTLEDPIEYLFENQQSIINQREIGSDTADLATALRNAMRQAPDCILIGEIRDREAMAAALAYAQSGHLVLATLHANNAYHALHRILSFYPIENRPTLLQDLASTLKAIIGQRLLRPADAGKRLAAVEVMVNTRHIAELIEQGDVAQIRDAMDQSLSPGSQSFEQALLKLVQEGLITQDEALVHADSATNLLWLLNNGPDSHPGSASAPADAATGASFSGFQLDH